jgi:hypothetical protein
LFVGQSQKLGGVKARRHTVKHSLRPVVRAYIAADYFSQRFVFLAHLLANLPNLPNCVFIEPIRHRLLYVRVVLDGELVEEEVVADGDEFAADEEFIIVHANQRHASVVVKV